jgi:hypothetical protein
MKTERTKIIKRKTLAVALALAGAAMLVATPVSVAGLPHALKDSVDYTYFDYWSFCEPVQVHVTGVQVNVAPIGSSYIVMAPQNLKQEYTSLITGNSVSVEFVGNVIYGIEVDDSGEVFEVTGGVVIKNGKQTLVFGGLVRIHLNFETGELTVLKVAGTRGDPFLAERESFADLICAALQ